MKSIMRTILRNTKLVMILAFLPALLCAAQAQAVDYQTKYKGTMYNVQSTASYGASAPTMGFRSTSVYSSQFSNGEQSMLNADGTVNDEAYGVGSRHHLGSIRREGREEGEGNTGTPGQTGDKQPLGDVVWPLMLLLCAYAGYKKVRARKEGLSQ